LQSRFRHTQRQVDHLGAPDVDDVPQRSDHRLNIAGARTAEDVRGVKPDSGSDGEDNIGDGRAMRCALQATKWFGLRTIAVKEAALNGATLAGVLLFEGRSINAAVEDGHAHARTRGARVAQQAIGPNESQNVVERGGHFAGRLHVVSGRGGVFEHVLNALDHLEAVLDGARAMPHG
jgi:hypothetical protein